MRQDVVDRDRGRGRDRRRRASNRPGDERARRDIRYAAPRSRSPAARRGTGRPGSDPGQSNGCLAVDALEQGESHKMVGEIQGELVLTPFEQTWTQPKTVATSLMSLLTELAR